MQRMAIMAWVLMSGVVFDVYAMRILRRRDSCWEQEFEDECRLPQNQLWDAINRDSASLVVQALRRGADKDADSQGPLVARGYIPLTWAVEIGDGQGEVVKQLLKHKANINRYDTQGMTALWRAVGNNNEQIVRLLLASKAIVDAQHDSLDTPLILASQKGYGGIVELLLEGNADVARKNSKGQDALMIAAENKHMALLEVLIAAGARWQDDTWSIVRDIEKQASQLSAVYSLLVKQELFLVSAMPTDAKGLIWEYVGDHYSMSEEEGYDAWQRRIERRRSRRVQAKRVLKEKEKKAHNRSIFFCICGAAGDDPGC